ncbi:putative ABC transporter permease [Paraeggerthella hongkongensis]|uniref:putative ABC transporter permease n=2 Tax=Eggerthellaceae TaxID=1643826 RepID=UPI001C101A24|nr:MULTISPECIES: putative ABC transporter permease [Paraeggerthella]MBU5404384.1 putative ABC transporter permease [Paraeggerthella hongkongensis]MCD2432080.1 putative ABC transporter permease [Paraeggerthella hominis]MDY3981636.1 putative ABC transporter permease [Paraeggerthella sp.]
MEKEPQNSSVFKEIGQEVREQVKPNFGYLKIDYFTLFWLFVAGSMFGLAVETIFHAIVYGGYESRAGLVWGPFSPIYGMGAVLLTVSLNRFHHSHNLIIFIVSMVLGSAIEYTASWLMEVLWGAIAWDYAGTFGSIGGRTNFAFGVMWGLLGLLWVRIAMPLVKRAFSHVNARTTTAKALTAAASVLMALNIAVTVLALDRESQRAQGVPAVTWEQRALDEWFPQPYMQEHFHNMSVYGK